MSEYEAYKVFTAKEYNHYKTYQDGHYKVLRKNKSLVEDGSFREMMIFFQDDKVDERTVEYRLSSSYAGGVEKHR